MINALPVSFGHLQAVWLLLAVAAAAVAGVAAIDWIEGKSERARTNARLREIIRRAAFGAAPAVTTLPDFDGSEDATGDDRARRR